MSLTPDLVIVDVFKEIVEAVEAEAVALGVCETVRYEHGSPEEFLKVLHVTTNTAGYADYAGKPKYPCIYLLQDFPEKIPGVGGHDKDVELPVIAIMGLSEQNLSSEERYTKTFKPLLLPLYVLLKKHIAKHPRVVLYDPNNIPHTKYDRLFYGRHRLGTNVIDYVDAVELTNIKLTFAQATTC